MTSATCFTARSRSRFEFDVVLVTVRVPLSHQLLTGCICKLAVRLKQSYHIAAGDRKLTKQLKYLHQLQVLR